MKIILASGSPRRTELLDLIHIPHLVYPSTVEEKITDFESPEQVVKILSHNKAVDVANKFPNDLIIGADTIVVVDNKILGKPQVKEEAKAMLKKLSNRTHEVFTGVTIIYQKQTHSFISKAEVTFYTLTDEEIEEYIRTENVYDKAGAYGIQDSCAKFIKKINGDFYTIMGLPVAEVYQHLKQIKK